MEDVIDTPAETVAEPSAPAGPSMDDTARETYRAVMESGDMPEEIADDKAVTEKPARTRGADGRFAKGEEPAPANTADPAEPAEQTQTKPHDAYPNTWGKDLAETWKTLPENVRQQIHKREQDMHNGIRQYRDAAGFGQQMAQEMLPYQQIMREKGVTPQGVVRDIMKSLHTMVTGSEESKAQTFLQLAQSYGINLDTVMSLGQRSPSQAAPDLAPVLQRVQQIETRISQADQQRAEAERAEDDRAVNAFLNDPKNEHAQTVRQQMSSLLLSGQAKDLADAYSQAIWLHPEVRAKLLEKQETERRKKEAEEAAAARKAAAANVTRRGTPPAPNKPGSMEDTARAIYRRLNS